MFESRRIWLERTVKDPKNEDYYFPNTTEEDIKETERTIRACHNRTIRRLR